MNAADCDGNTPAHYAVLNGNEEGYIVMTNMGADLTLKNNRGQSADELFKEFKQKQETEKGEKVKEADESMRDPDEPVQVDEGVQLKVRTHPLPELIPCLYHTDMRGLQQEGSQAGQL